MPSKKKKYNARFPAGRIKKIMQTDEEVGKVAQAVPVIISRTLELFVESLLTKSMQITQARNAKTLTPSHMKQCILSESRFDFLKDLVKNIPDASIQEDNENNAMYEASLNDDDGDQLTVDVDMNESPPKTPAEPTASSSRPPVIKYGPKVTQEKNQRLYASRRKSREEKNLNQKVTEDVPISQLVPAPSSSSSSTSTSKPHTVVSSKVPTDCNSVPPLIPIPHNFYIQNSGDSLCIDEDYDN